jgi:hypothetical protein
LESDHAPEDVGLFLGFALAARTFAKRPGFTVVAILRLTLRTTLRADPSAIGRSISLDQNACTVVGVTPEAFSFYPTQTQMWVLLGPGYQPQQDQMLVGIFARLRPGITLEQAQSELRSLFRTIHMDSETQRVWTQ